LQNPQGLTLTARKKPVNTFAAEKFKRITGLDICLKLSGMIIGKMKGKYQ
jgi:hypothetical protein